jgi:hypothetical protein
VNDGRREELKGEQQTRVSNWIGERHHILRL